jgi:hypothetical protein
VAVFSLDRQAIGPITKLVYCPIRDRDVSLERCAACPRKVGQDPHDPPRYIVCEARRLVGWLGMDAAFD